MRFLDQKPPPMQSKSPHWPTLCCVPGTVAGFTALCFVNKLDQLQAAATTQCKATALTGQPSAFLARYYWMHRLAGRKVGPWACWVTGWLNLLGECSMDRWVGG